LEAQKENNFYREDINLLRGLAVLVVCLYHFWPKYITGGYVGVDIFFVISGYLITGNILSDISNKKFSFTNFYSKRIRRIFPTLILLLVMLLIFGYFFFLPQDFLDLLKHQFYAISFISNFGFWREINYFNSAAELKPLLHIWSLAIEEQFYLVWPFLIYFSFKKNLNLKLTVSLVLIISLSLNLLFFSKFQSATFYLPITRSWELCLGAILSIFSYNKSKLISVLKLKIFYLLGLILILISVFYFDQETLFPGVNALMPTVGSGLMIISGKAFHFRNKNVVKKIFNELGSISYSLYLFHWPLLSINYLSLDIPHIDHIILFVLSVFLAFIATHCFEKPIKKNISLSKSTKYILTVYLLLFFLMCYLFYNRAQISIYFDKDRLGNAIDTLKKYESFDCKINYEYSDGCNFRTSDQYAKASIDDSCYMPKYENKPTIFMWGDSHMQALSYGIKERFYSSHNILQVCTHSSKPTLNGDVDDVSKKSNLFALNVIEKVKPETVILAQNNGHLKNDWLSLYNQLKKMGVKRIILFGPSPKWYPTLPRVLLKEGNLSTSKISLKYLDKYVISDDRRLRLVCKKIGIEYVSIIDNLIINDEILIREPVYGELLVFDYGHLTPKASKWIINTLASKIIK
jgi:peptidoglycan/LPS O-acetylase OafA/YrhL